MINSRTISLDTKDQIQFLDITQKVNRFVGDANVKEGLVMIFSPHTTNAIFINENEKGLMKDYERLLQIFPKGAGYQHDKIDNNSDAHLRSISLGSNVTIPIQNGSLQLGTWQHIFLAELDGPRNRKIIFQVIGE